jgi:hypothetical protein
LGQSLRVTGHGQTNPKTLKNKKINQINKTIPSVKLTRKFIKGNQRYFISEETEGILGLYYVKDL